MLTNVLFVCHGNICRSPMAEFVFKDMVEKAGLSSAFNISSAAVSTEEVDNPVYPPAKAQLSAHGISCQGKRARQMTAADFEHNDLILVMDNSNLAYMSRRFGTLPDKVKLLSAYTVDPHHEIADPWYSGNFALAYAEIVDGCQALLKALT